MSEKVRTTGFAVTVIAFSISLYLLIYICGLPLFKTIYLLILLFTVIFGAFLRFTLKFLSSEGRK